MARKKPVESLTLEGLAKSLAKMGRKIASLHVSRDEFAALDSNVVAALDSNVVALAASIRQIEAIKIKDVLASLGARTQACETRCLSAVGSVQQVEKDLATHVNFLFQQIKDLKGKVEEVRSSVSHAHEKYDLNAKLEAKPTIKLRACPFCNGPVQEPTSEDNFWFVRCSKCETTTRGKFKPGDKSIMAAIVAWNMGTTA